MSNQRFTPEFKDEATRQVTERGYSVAQSEPATCAKIIDGVVKTFAAFQHWLN